MGEREGERDNLHIQTYPQWGGGGGRRREAEEMGPFLTYLSVGDRKGVRSTLQHQHGGGQGDDVVGPKKAKLGFA